MPLCTIGDLLLDVVVRLEASLAPDDDTPAATHVTAGGQAANVAAWAASLGVRARLIARRGDDGAAQLAASEIAARGVDLVGPVAAGASAGVVVSVVDGSGARSMLTDRGPSRQLRAEEIDVRWLRGCDVLHVSGYAMLDGPIAQAAAKAAGAARAQGARISVDLASARGIADFGAERLLTRLGELAPDVVFASDGELEAVGREPDVPKLVVKHGAGGVTVVSDGHREEHSAIAADVVDTTGAGDALAAGFLVGGVALGLEAAARCVSQPGAMP
jgi:sugar/nucleoside kinase (ribokinase family)